jgi:hypothetical protein
MRQLRGFVRAYLAFTRVLALCAVGAGLSVSVQPTQAQENSPIASPSAQFSSGMVGLASGQTARLNVVNVGAAAPSPLPCVLVLAFVDSDGKILTQKFVSVASNKAALLDLPSSDVSGDSGDDGNGTNAARRQIRGIGYNPLLTPESAIPQPLSCHLIPTLELLDTDTGRTAVIVTDFNTPASSTSVQVPGQP